MKLISLFQILSKHVVMCQSQANIGPMLAASEWYWPGTGSLPYVRRVNIGHLFKADKS